MRNKKNKHNYYAKHFRNFGIQYVVVLINGGAAEYGQFLQIM